jgi:hypothetical protein
MKTQKQIKYGKKKGCNEKENKGKKERYRKKDRKWINLKIP